MEVEYSPSSVVTQAMNSSMRVQRVERGEEKQRKDVRSEAHIDLRLEL